MHFYFVDLFSIYFWRHGFGFNMLISVQCCVYDDDLDFCIIFQYAVYCTYKCFKFSAADMVITLAINQ